MVLCRVVSDLDRVRGDLICLKTVLPLVVLSVALDEHRWTRNIYLKFEGLRRRATTEPDMSVS